jgi:glycosyltransferase involved in cell wall biosynthesis
MSKKTVLVVSSTFPRWKNDSRPSFVYELCNHVRNYKIIVLAPHYYGAKKKEKMANLTVYRFKYFFERYQTLCSGAGILSNSETLSGKIQFLCLLKAECRAIKKFLSQEKIDIIHAYWIIPQGIVASAACGKVPLIISGMGSDIFYGLNNAFFRFLQKKALNKAKKIIVTSTALKNELVSKLPETKEKVKIIPIGLDTDKFKPTRKASELASKYKGKILLTIGRLSEQKGIQYLLRALHHVIGENPTVKLLIIGEGSYREELVRIIRELGLEKQVIFVGAVPHERIADYLSVADIFVFPSLSDKRFGTEAFGVVLLEALATKTPVVATNIGGIRDIIKHKKNGMLVEQKNAEQLGKAINYLFGNQEEAKRLGEEGYRFVRRHFDWNLIARELEQAYDKVSR